MKHLLIAAVLLASASSAHAEPLTIELTTCDTEDAMVEYTTRTLTKEPYQDVLADMNKDGEVCRLAMTMFEPLEPRQSFDRNGITYEIVAVHTIAKLSQTGGNVAIVEPFEGNRFAMRYFKSKAKDA